MVLLLPIHDAHHNPLSAYNPQWRTSRPAEITLGAALLLLNVRRYLHLTVSILDHNIAAERRHPHLRPPQTTTTSQRDNQATYGHQPKLQPR
ncbi:MAG: hypothetical protein QW518_06965, partial [Thermofilaceae archaeon]